MRVLIAADDTQTSIDAARSAHHLFGDTADYIVVNVSPNTGYDIPFGYTFPLAMPVMTAGVDIGPAYVSAINDAEMTARDRAAQVAREADISPIALVGETGDPAAAILDAAARHNANVIAVGSHDRGWLSRLFAKSVSDTVVRDADVPVLVVK